MIKFFSKLIFSIIFLFGSTQCWSIDLHAKYQFKGDVSDQLSKVLGNASGLESREIEKEATGEVVIYLSSGKSRVETSKSTTHHVSYGETYKQLEAMPVKDEAVMKTLEALSAQVKPGVYVYTKQEIDIEVVADKAVLDIDIQIEKKDAGVDKVIKKKQNLKPRRREAKECLPGLYHYRGSVNRQLIGCGLLESIKEGRVVKTGEEDTFVVEQPNADGEGIQKSRHNCEYYEFVDPPQIASQGSVLYIKQCIAFHGEMPIVYYRESATKDANSSEPIKSTYTLSELNLLVTPDSDLFEFKKNSVCPGDINERQSC